MKQHLSPDDLFAAARADRPSDEALDDVWKRVSTAVAVPAAATTVGVVSAKTAAFSVKSAVAFGVVMGAVGTVLVVGSIGAFDRSESSARPPQVRTTIAHDGTSGARLEETPVRSRAEQVVPPPKAPSVRVVAATSKPTVDDDGSALALEARLLTAARNALVREEPARALEMLTTVRHLPVRALEPEEHRLEARALRALGRADEAAAIELELRRVLDP